MANFYTNVQSIGGHIYYRGVMEGKRAKQRVEYSPSLYLPSKRETEYKALDGSFLEKKKFENIYKARDYIKQFDGVSNGVKIYGNNRFEYAFIADQHSGMVEWEKEKIVIGAIDIEVGSENGFPDPYLANAPITAITITYLNGQTIAIGCGDYIVQGDEIYIKCEDETALCRKFLDLWSKKYPDVVTGWNSKFFDIPYIINRFRKLLGENDTNKLSPWGFIKERKTTVNNRQLIAYEIVGISSLDYIELYKSFAPKGKSQESYRLDAIAQVELGEGKISYDEYENLHQLYRLNYQKFIEYNIKDVALVLRLEDKLKLLELAMALAYDTKCNFEDVFTQTRMWDSLTYSYLLQKNIIVPPRESHDKSEAFEGAYVKEVQVGAHDYVASFDLDSLYPHLIMQYNISPETLIEPMFYTDEMRKLISDGVTVDKLLLKKVDTTSISGATFTPNGQFFRTDVRGFLPAMMDEMYEDRKKYKKLMLQAEQEYEDERDDSKKFDIEKKISRYKNLQLAKKLSLNSAYGALGSQYFRFYDLRMAIAVTSAGKLSIRWIESKINAYMNNLLKTDKDYVIASDTDSIYLKLGDLVNKVYPNKTDVKQIISFMDKVCDDKLQPYINKSFQELADYVHAYAQKMRMKREALADKGIWTAKKRYILNVYNNEGVQYNEPEMKVVGLEMVKSSTPAAIREQMKQIIKIILTSTEADVQRFVLNFKQEFKKLPPEDISFPRSVRGLKKYADPVTLYCKGTPMHVKGSIIYNHVLNQKDLSKKYPYINEGEKIKFSYLKLPNPFKDTVISFPSRLPKEFNINEYIDYDMQFEKSFVEPISVILNCMNWSIEERSTLDSFFG